MAKNNELGGRGEQMAADYLLAKGYTLVARNWTFERAEVDIIVLINDIYVFVEVKTRSTNYFGYPEQAVTPAKQRLLAKAASAFITQNGIEGNIRFDVIAITFVKEKAELLHIEDAFFIYDNIME